MSSLKERLLKLFGCFTAKENDEPEPIKRGEISESWSHWRIIIIDKNGEKEADPNLYTRLGRVKIKFKQECFSVSTILNSIFNINNVSKDREIKAKLISILFSSVMIETKECIMRSNPKVISNSERIAFIKNPPKIKWLKENREEFDLEEAINNFFQREEDNLGSTDARLFPDQENTFFFQIL
ncbi:Oidioi.mRNA.OKI2018_I69.chr1.g228.t1.cds [Oikopleura dioica]|uniref:Oidioi.mRNA.OKI2018_I69.chr1.g228.t1.cds n=1 Tax=Oikopleura dioica TaxID=34765 RepID=A0ABN7SRE6_OIKDI|nr:Oidioi.mRNA.OKI2018_I69.chr1.g228.t1.cds [Oikopleura dioica]